MAEKIKKRWGDRRDARRVRDIPGLNTVMANIMPYRTESEVFFKDEFDITEVLKFIAAKNEEHPNYKTTIFHAIVFAIAKMIRERPKMNRFIQGRWTYERYDITMSFVAKRRFADGAEESLLCFKMKDDETLDSLSHKIYGDVRETRKSEHSTGGIDSVVDGFAKIPRLILMLALRIVRYLDFWGINPKVLTDGDTNYTTCLLSNLGSIGCPSVYHHLNNYGTNSFMVTVGTIHKAPRLMPDGSIQVRDVIDIGATLDERIADGFYFARSLKVVHYLLEHPELLEKPLGESSGFEYK